MLVLGILGLAGMSVLAPIAWRMGNRALAEIDANPSQWTNRGQVATGRTLAIIGTVLLGIAVLLLILGTVAIAIGLLAVEGVTPKTDLNALVFLVGVLAICVVLGWMLGQD